MDLKNIDQYFKPKTNFKSRRDELVSLITEDINRLREGTKFKQVTKKMIALRINLNPFLAKDDTAIEELYKECHEKSNYAKFWWLTKMESVV